MVADTKGDIMFFKYLANFLSVADKKDASYPRSEARSVGSRAIQAFVDGAKAGDFDPEEVFSALEPYFLKARVSMSDGRTRHLVMPYFFNEIAAAFVELGGDLAIAAFDKLFREDDGGYLMKERIACGVSSLLRICELHPDFQDKAENILVNHSGWICAHTECWKDIPLTPITLPIFRSLISQWVAPTDKENYVFLIEKMSTAVQDGSIATDVAPQILTAVADSFKDVANDVGRIYLSAQRMMAAKAYGALAELAGAS